MRKLLILLLLITPTVYAQKAWTVRDVPNTRLKSNSIHISDPDDWIDAAYEQKINTVLSNIQSEADVFVVVLTSIGDQDTRKFCTDLFNYWGIGDAKRDNGLLLLLVHDQHKFRFETGYGLEATLPDALCQKVFEHNKNYFTERDYNNGIYACVCAVAGVLGNLPEDSTITESEISSLKSASKPKTERERNKLWTIIIILIIINIALILLSIKNHNNLRKTLATPNNPKWVGRAFTAFRQNLLVLTWISIAVVSPWLILLYLYYLFAYRRMKKEYRNRPQYCSHCKTLMHHVPENEKRSFMTENQVFEEDTMKVDEYDVWQCDSCGQTTAIPFFLKKANKYFECPSCGCLAGKKDHDTVEIKATYSYAGKGLHHITCCKCQHEFTKKYTIPKKSSSRGDDSSGSYDSGGGSFGGGESGGGGFSGDY